MNEDLVKMRQATAKVMASERQMNAKYQQAQATADEWLRRAELAVRKGQDDLAREALSRRKGADGAAAALKVQLDAQRRALEQLTANVRAMEGKVTEARNKVRGFGGGLGGLGVAGGGPGTTGRPAGRPGARMPRLCPLAMPSSSLLLRAPRSRPSPPNHPTPPHPTPPHPTPPHPTPPHPTPPHPTPPQRETLKSRAAAAKSSKQVQEMVAGLRLNTTNAWAAFDVMEEKVIAMEAEVRLGGKLGFGEAAGRQGGLRCGA
jgi:phage shock protein A